MREEGWIAAMKLISSKPIKKGGNVITLEFVHEHSGPCAHPRLEVDQRKSEVTCLDCGGSLNPMWALHMLATQESRLSYRIDQLAKLSAEIDKRVRCKCDHCGKITRIHA